ncbi:hypothetical protein [Arthrobacter bambusae]|uniref:hypothetical protein n=1 Tax=Arthrobacter bambusae TaxID=1338426 RepID=UPI00278B6BF2|nr:hypothetical protein [Arthrobacter bambusae]MDQ0028732.1 nitrate/nitrite transporter NarK [Arthrobacter bambusae]MDQ0096475.1 nitrate/nitrite transporter NarK [Arthrobacter bambusae]
MVSAAGGLGGYLPPLVMGATHDAATHSYSIGLLLRVVMALVALGFTVLAMQGAGQRRGLFCRSSLAHNAIPRGGRGR